MVHVRRRVDLESVQRFVRGVVEIGRVATKRPFAARRHRAVLQRLAIGNDTQRPEFGRLGRSLTAPVPGYQVVHALPFAGQGHRDRCKLKRGAALHEQHGVFIGNPEQLAQVPFGLLGKLDELTAPVAVLHDRQAAALPAQQFLAGLLQNGKRKVRRTGAEVEDPVHAYCLEADSSSSPARVQKPATWSPSSGRISRTPCE